MFDQRIVCVVCFVFVFDQQIDCVVCVVCVYDPSADFVCVHDPSAGFVCALDVLRKARTYAVCSATHVTYFLDYSMNCLFTPEL